MKLLHTSDWHVGKSLRGRDRSNEHQAVLSEVVGVAAEHGVDVVVVAGDLFDSAAPSPQAERLVYQTLMDLGATGAQVVVIAGNHDNPRRLEALTPVFAATGQVRVLARPSPAAQGGVQTITVRGDDEVTLALLPFVSKRGIVRSRELWDLPAYDLAQRYQQQVAGMIDVLCGEFRSDTANVFVTHAFVDGGATGGGERPAHLIDEYLIPSQMLPATASYIALGHLHRPQKVASASPTYYCGSPLQMDFGESDQRKQVNIVDLKPGVPGKVSAVELTGGWPLLTISGSLEALRAQAEGLDPEAWYRVRVDEARRAGLADDVRDVLGEAGHNAVEITVTTTTASDRSPRRYRPDASPQELFATYLEEQGYVDDRLNAAFADLLDGAT